MLKDFVSFKLVMCAQSLSCVRLFETLWTVARQAPLSMGILQARILEWVVMSSSRESSRPRDRTQLSHTAGRSLPSEPPGKPKNTRVGGLSLLQGNFPTQELNRGLLHCRQIFTSWATQEALKLVLQSLIHCYFWGTVYSLDQDPMFSFIVSCKCLKTCHTL